MPFGVTPALLKVSLVDCCDCANHLGKVKFPQTFLLYVEHSGHCAIGDVARDFLLRCGEVHCANLTIGLKECAYELCCGTLFAVLVDLARSWFGYDHGLFLFFSGWFY